MSIPLPSIAGLPQAVQDKIAEFNARPARRVTDVRIQGWSVVEPQRSYPGHKKPGHWFETNTNGFSEE
jgi:hypothetical protein